MIIKPNLKMLRCNVMKLTDKSTGTYISNLNKTLTYQVLRRDQAKNVNIKKVSLGKATAPRQSIGEQTNPLL